MFNIGPMELLVLGIVALIVIGPEKLPQLTREAAQLIRTLRELASGARTQLREELGPEFADLDLRSLNPRTALTRAVLGDTDLRSLDPREAVRRSWLDDDEDDDLDRPATRPTAVDADDTTRRSTSAQSGSSVDMSKNTGRPAAPPPRPLGRNEAAPYDSDAT